MHKHIKGIMWAVAVAVAAYVLWANLFIVAATDRYIENVQDAAQAHADCVLVLGAQVEGGKPGDILKNRLDCGIALYKQGVASRLLLTGAGTDANDDEVSVMAAYAQQAGVPAQDILADRQGYNTYRSMYRAKNVYGVGSVVVVTQKFHLNRSLYIARALGMDAVGVAAQPAGSWMFVWETREVGARCKDFLTSWLKPVV